MIGSVGEWGREHGEYAFGVRVTGGGWRVEEQSGMADRRIMIGGDLITEKFNEGQN